MLNGQVVQYFWQVGGLTDTMQHLPVVSKFISKVYSSYTTVTILYRNSFSYGKSQLRLLPVQNIIIHCLGKINFTKSVRLNPTSTSNSFTNQTYADTAYNRVLWITTGGTLQATLWTPQLSMGLDAPNSEYDLWSEMCLELVCFYAQRHIMTLLHTLYHADVLGSLFRIDTYQTGAKDHVQFIILATQPENLLHCIALSYLTNRKASSAIVGEPCHIILKWTIPVAVFEAKFIKHLLIHNSNLWCRSNLGTCTVPTPGLKRRSSHACPAWVSAYNSAVGFCGQSQLL